MFPRGALIKTLIKTFGSILPLKLGKVRVGFSLAEGGSSGHLGSSGEWGSSPDAPSGASSGVIWSHLERHLDIWSVIWTVIWRRARAVIWTSDPPSGGGVTGGGHITRESVV